MAARKRVRKLVLVGDPNPELAEVGQAVQVALAVLAHTRCDTWPVLAARSETDPTVVEALSLLRLTSEQTRLLKVHAPILEFIATKPLTSISLCPECERWSVVSGTAPKKCKLTLRCTGTPVKPAAVKRYPVRDDEYEPGDDYREYFFSL